MKPLIFFKSELILDEQRRIRSERRVNQFLIILLWLISVFFTAAIINAALR